VYVSVRTYRAETGSVDDLMHRLDRDLAEAFAQDAGFIAYDVTRTGERTVASMTLFEAREETEASNELAAEWVTESLDDFGGERMGVMGGEMMVSHVNASVLRPSAH
jgi:hypothetical protein